MWWVHCDSTCLNENQFSDNQDWGNKHPIKITINNHGDIPVKAASQPSGHGISSGRSPLGNWETHWLTGVWVVPKIRKLVPYTKVSVCVYCISIEYYTVYVENIKCCYVYLYLYLYTYIYTKSSIYVEGSHIQNGHDAAVCSAWKPLVIFSTSSSSFPTRL
jgi:hypothetical protein